MQFCVICGIDIISILQFWLLKTGFAHKLRNEVIFYSFVLLWLGLFLLFTIIFCRTNFQILFICHIIVCEPVCCCWWFVFFSSVVFHSSFTFAGSPVCMGLFCVCLQLRTLPYVCVYVDRNYEQLRTKRHLNFSLKRRNG